MLRTELDVTVSVQIDRPREQVWAFIAYVSRLPDWVGEFEAAEIVGGGVPGVGTTIRYQLARGRAGTYELTEWDPPRRLAWDGPPLAWLRGGGRPRGSFELAEADGGTRFVARYRPELLGPPALLRPYVRRWLVRQRRIDVAQLKRLVEDESQ